MGQRAHPAVGAASQHEVSLMGPEQRSLLELGVHSEAGGGANQKRIAGYECPKSEDGVVLSVTAIWQVAPHGLSVSTNQPMVRKRLADQLVSQTGHHCLARPLHIPVSSPLLFWLLGTAPHHLVTWLLGKP